jgi:hypothetical protein
MQSEASLASHGRGTFRSQLVKASPNELHRRTPRNLDLANVWRPIPSLPKYNLIRPLPAHSLSFDEVRTSGREDSMSLAGTAWTGCLKDYTLHALERLRTCGISEDSYSGVVYDIELVRHGIEGTEDSNARVNRAQRTSQNNLRELGTCLGSPYASSSAIAC